MLKQFQILVSVCLTLFIFSAHSYAYQWNNVEKFFKVITSSRLEGTGTWFQLFEAVGRSLPCGLGKSLTSCSSRYTLKFYNSSGCEKDSELVEITFAEPDWMWEKKFNRVAILPLVSEQLVRRILSKGGRIFMNGKWLSSEVDNGDGSFSDITGDWKISTKINPASCSWVNGPSLVDVEWKESSFELRVRMHLEHYRSEGQYDWSTIYYYPGQMVIQFSQNPFLLTDMEEIKKSFKRVTTDSWYVGVFNQQKISSESTGDRSKSD